ncbi:Mor transcription activator family protein [Agarivorans gilvus]|uniref:DNA-binding protein n=1 Tax=Agarivorans gilvus TaxID=680279 RepID=A0ABQ1HX98_9ALTE|nr:Mor transcription activator family protein [Agarivorans gilvus]GGA96000.1 DNA-binding protein [Agarivorans gilvus]
MNIDKLIAEDLKERTATFLLDIQAHLCEGLTNMTTLSEEQASELANSVVDHIRKAYGGETLYIPKGKELETALLHHSIFREFNGRNHKALAKKYGVSEQWVYSVTKQMQKRIKDKMQLGLFGE